MNLRKHEARVAGVLYLLMAVTAVVSLNNVLSWSRVAGKGLLSTETLGAKEVFTHLFKKYGLPKAIRSDNGAPFASTALGRLSQLSVWWIRLGIRPELIEPCKPQQNGQYERRHRTLKAETTRPPASNLNQQQGLFNRFIREYNEVRPHEGIGLKRPATLYEASTLLLQRKYRSWFILHISRRG